MTQEEHDMETRTARVARTVSEIRAEAAAHARQIEAVLWMETRDLAARWGVSLSTVRKIPRDKLPYLTLGETHVRRYHPDDVAAFETASRQEPAA